MPDISTRFHSTLPQLAVLFLAATLAACGDSSSSDPDDDTGEPTPLTITGTVSAPGGTLAFNPPTGLKRWLATLFGAPAHAALTNTGPVDGATVSLIQIDGNGAQVGDAIATATTANGGAYTLSAPSGFTAGSTYVIKAAGSVSTLNAFVTGTTVDVDPSTEAVKELIIGAVAGGSLSGVSVSEIETLQQTVQEQIQELDTTPATTGDYVTGLTTFSQNDEETSNILSSLVSAATISGTVKDASNNALAGVRMVVRDHSNWVTRAIGKTGSDGSFSVNVPAGDYIVGAINTSTSNTAASEWYTAGGGSANQFSAEKVTVATTTALDFVLDNGGRVGGTVKASDGATPLHGIRVVLRDFTNDTPAFIAVTKTDGTFAVNVKPGTYTVTARNTTMQPYASSVYNGAASGGTVTGGGGDASQGTPIVITENSTITTDFTLADGYRIAGLVGDGAAADPLSSPLTGIAVRFYKAPNDATNGAFVDGLRSNKAGRYRLWLKPDVYDVLARGQIASAVDITAANALATNFVANVGAVTATIKDSGGNAVPQAKVRVYDSGFEYKGFEVSNGDGTVTIYSNVTDDHVVEIKIDNGQMIGSTIYSGFTRLLDGDVVPFTLGQTLPIDSDTGGTTPFPTVTLPAGGVLSGTVTAQTGGTPLANVIVQVRKGGTGNNARFVSTRTQSDGTYSVSVPDSVLGGAYDRVCAFIPPLPATTGCSNDGYAVANNVTVTASQTTDQDFVIVIPVIP